MQTKVSGSFANTETDETGASALRSGARPKMLNHLAYFTQDIGATADFYTKILHFKLGNVVLGDRVDSSQPPMPFFHLFLTMDDGSTLAFFECPDIPERPPSAHWVYDIFDHLALEVENVEELASWREHLERHGIEVTNIVDHGIIKSIYFHDPVNGIRLELTTPMEADWNAREEYTRTELQNWLAVKEAARASNSNVKEALLKHSAGRNKFGGSRLDPPE